MQSLVDRLFEQLKAKGLSEEKALNVAVESLRKRGHIKQDSLEETPEGVRLSKMSPEDRARERFFKNSFDKDQTQYWYDPAANKMKKIEY